MQQDNRWRQRFENFSKAYPLLVRASVIEQPSEIEKMGLIQAFEIVFELAWKVLQDYLNAQGYQTVGPRQAIKQAYQDALISEGHLWLEALMDRNQTAHIYDENKINTVVQHIKVSYLSFLQQFNQQFQTL